MNAPEQQGTPGPWLIQVTGGEAETIVGTETGMCVNVRGKRFETRRINARLIVVAVNACRQAMPGLTDQQRIRTLGAGALQQIVGALVECKATIEDACVARDPYANNGSGLATPTEQVSLELARASLEAIGGI